MSNNTELQRIFREIADFLMDDDSPFRQRAYRRAADSLDELTEDIRAVYDRGGLKELQALPGVGKAIAERIEEYVKTGKVTYHEQLKKELPVAMAELVRVEGLGPKRVRTLFMELGIKSLKDLEKAAQQKKIAPLVGFGEKAEENILEAIGFLERSAGRSLIGYIAPTVEEVLGTLKRHKDVERVEAVGSFRRGQETIGDVDFLVAAKKSEAIMDYFCSLPGIEKVLAKGPTKSSVHMVQGFDMDVRVVEPDSFGAASQYFTGSKAHNIATRKVAIAKGLKLNEYGLFRGEKKIAGDTEGSVYEALGMAWPDPELREDTGEIEAALADKLPKLVQLEDITGDIHCHSSWNGGENTIKEMAEAAQKRGYQYIGIADHTKFLKIENGLDEKQLAAQRKEIDTLNKEFTKKNFRILQGCEANIMKDGSIDITDEALSKLDFVIAGVHSHMKLELDEMMQRLERAMRNPHVDIISHPTGRILQRRDEYAVDIQKLLQLAKETGTVLEINAAPERLDLNAENVRRAKDIGVKMIINTDSHHRDSLQFMRFGVSQARRGWAEKSDIVNTGTAGELLAQLK